MPNYPLPSTPTLPISYLSHLFDNMSECYKLFWFKAILDNVCEGKEQLSFEELIDCMIADVWYMVTEYRLNLGPSDTLEALVKSVYQKSGLKSSEKRERIIAWLHEGEYAELLRMKRTLTNQVPFRLQAPFITSLKGREWDIPRKDLAERINKEERLLYYFVDISGLKSKIVVAPEWQDYLRTNQVILRGWIQYHIIQYLQKRNPSVPGIVNKIYPPQARKLERVTKYWKAIISCRDIHEIYGECRLTEDKLSIDHFIPWSYVAHDELWNLHPTTRSINSSKSNCLPDWDSYFSKLCSLEYQAYEATWAYEGVHKEFDKCLKEHVNNDDVRAKLYRQGLTKLEFEKNLEGIMWPVYQSARELGFENWLLPSTLTTNEVQ